MRICFNKIVWGMRAFFYSFYFNEFKMPSYMGKPVFISGGTNIKIGKRTRIFPGIRLEAIDDGLIDIGSNVAIEQNVHITSKGGKLTIGDDCTVLANVFITNIDHVYTDVEKSILEQPCIYKETRLGDGCFVGAGAAIQAGTILGRHCVVGANSVVRGEFPDYCVLVGAPAKIIKRYNPATREWNVCKQMG